MLLYRATCNNYVGSRVNMVETAWILVGVGMSSPLSNEPCIICWSPMLLPLLLWKIPIKTSGLHSQNITDKKILYNLLDIWTHSKRYRQGTNRQNYPQIIPQVLLDVLKRYYTIFIALVSDMLTTAPDARVELFALFRQELFPTSKRESFVVKMGPPPPSVGRYFVLRRAVCPFGRYRNISTDQIGSALPVFSMVPCKSRL